MQQVARNATLEGEGYLKGCRYGCTIETRSSARTSARRSRLVA